jgi:hypothetical protein
MKVNETVTDTGVDEIADANDENVPEKVTVCGACTLTLLDG